MLEDLHKQLVADGRFALFLKGLSGCLALKAADSEFPLTFFVPTDEVILQHYPQLAENEEEQAKILPQLVCGHIVKQPLTSRDLAGVVILNPLSKQSIVVSFNRGILLNERVHILEKDIRLNDHVIHIVDGVFAYN